LIREAHDRIEPSLVDEVVWLTTAASAGAVISSRNSSIISGKASFDDKTSFNHSGVTEAFFSNHPTVQVPFHLAPNNSTNPLDRIKVPFPIFVASLPKSGTTSTARYFYCGNIWTAHTFANTVGTTHYPRKQMRVGHCFLNNIQAGRPPFHDCGRYKVWSDAGHPRGTPCFYPSVHGLHQFYAAYPSATILLVTRNSTAWSHSVLRWNKGALLKKWKRCQHFPNTKRVADLETFYNWHVQNLRDFAAARPSLTFVEFSLEDVEIGQQLEARIGVPADCFGHHNSYEAIKKFEVDGNSTLGVRALVE
jgi:hypothetical protein